MRTKKFAFTVALLILGAVALPAQQTFNTTIYFDYTYNLTNDGFKTLSQKDLNNKFQFRRAYLTYENKISDVLKFRFRYDADNTGNLTSVDLTKGTTSKDDKLRPFVKHLYLDYAGLFPNSSLKIGMTETLTFNLEENRWGYRSVAKTLVDGYKDITGKDIRASSADIGGSLTGTLIKEIRYGFMVMNGEGYSHPELNKFKKFAGQLQLVPLAGLSLVGYADSESQAPTGTATTYKFDGYFDMINGLTLGGSWFQYDNSNYKNTDLSHYNVSGFSAFGKLIAVRDKLNLFARFDRYNPNTTLANDEINLVIAGVDWAPVHSSFKLQPNIWYYTYSDSARKSDAVFNLTFFLSF